MRRRDALRALALACLSRPRAADAQTDSGPVELSSAALTLALRASPYQFEVVERATGRVLLRHRATGVREGSRILNGRRWATAARAVRRDADGVSARLDFDGDEAKTLQVSFRFVAPEVLKVSLRALYVQADASHGNVAITESFVDRGESIYGLLQAAWPRRGPGGLYVLDRGLDNRGAEVDLLGNRLHGWFDGMRFSSVRAPFYMTSAGYAIYVQSTWKGRYALAIDAATSFEFDDAELAYFVIYGPAYDAMLAHYNRLAGPSRLPPDWALGTIWWRDDIHEDLRRAGGGRHANAQEVLLGDVEALRRHRIPATAVWLDRPYAQAARPFGWGGVRQGCFAFDAGFPQPREMIEAVRSAGLELMLWIANRSDDELGDEGKPLGYLLDTDRAVDMRNPDAYRWFQDKLDCFVAQGVHGYKIDRGEEGEVPDHLQNLNAALFPRMAAEGLARRWGDDYFVFARNLYDTGRRHAAVWNGDSYGWRGLRESVRQALRCALMNFPMWGSDTGGYGETTPELFVRWSQFAAYTPMMEVLIGPARTPWLDFSPEVLALVTAQARTKHDLIPYVRSALFAATQTGMPVIRPLLLTHPHDAAVRELSDQYLYGPDLLVAPVVERGARTRELYLPDGRWLDYHDRTAVHAGGRSMSAEAPLSRIPVFVREGGIVPRGDVVRGNNTWSTPWAPRLRVEVFPSARRASAFTYYTGRAPRSIASRPAGAGFRLEVDELDVPAELAVLCHRPHAVLSGGRPLGEGTGYSYDAARRVLAIPLSGAAQLEVRAAPGAARSLSVF